MDGLLDSKQGVTASWSTLCCLCGLSAPGRSSVLSFLNIHKDAPASSVFESRIWPLSVEWGRGNISRSSWGNALAFCHSLEECCFGPAHGLPTLCLDASDPPYELASLPRRAVGLEQRVVERSRVWIELQM